MLANLISGWLKSLKRNDADSTAVTPSGGLSARHATSPAAEFTRRAQALSDAGRLSAALECYREWAHADPRAVDAWIGMGNTFVDLWSVDEAVAAFGKALELAPTSAKIFSALLFYSHYALPVNPRRLFDLHRQYGDAMRRTVPAGAASFPQRPDPDRRLRIGYVSPNLSRHSVGYFAEPVIEHHDRRNFEVYCYYTHELSDDATRRMRDRSDAWRDVAGATDIALEQTIRDDRIDILIDLAGHSKGNRLGVFARRAAPVQMTWLGYPDTTGLDTVDCRITDGVADPAPEADSRHTERLLRLDCGFLCYKPPQDSPPVSTPAHPPSDVVFASFNNILKVNRAMIEVWAGILARVPGSRLILKSASLNYPDTADRVRECCESCAIDPQRVELQGFIRDRHEHLAHYGNIDIALDTFPYNGTTTSCEALWMGVPVVSLAGDVHMSRVGATLLHGAGLPELVARSSQEYADLAVALAQDPGRRAALRTSLRDALRSSSLLDHAGFTHGLERAYRERWKTWCATRVTAG